MTSKEHFKLADDLAKQIAARTTPVLASHLKSMCLRNLIAGLRKGR